MIEMIVVSIIFLVDVVVGFHLGRISVGEEKNVFETIKNNVMSDEEAFDPYDVEGDN